MNKYFLYPALAICLLASCKKSDEKKLVGVWKATAMAIDTNGNGVMDTQEKWDESANNWGYAFKKGGDVEVNAGLTHLGTWQLKNGILTITAATSKDFKVLTLNSTDLTLEWSDEYGEKNWEVLKKQ
ncbi:lipocalin family protein [Polluticoccus soli]|uniref:lipocalin family protein n=1 Tax=Polluticoccus soli TaxID=3034150 RepID=UPI0023E21A02|nr:lipocalin family protein [Flavipsychrobacter sp. JY13-12]